VSLGRTSAAGTPAGRSGRSEALRSAGPTSHTNGNPIPPGAGLVRSAIEQVTPGLKQFTLQSRTNLG